MVYNFRTKRQADTFAKRLRTQFILSVRVSDYVVRLYDVQNLRDPERATRISERIFNDVTK